MTSARARTAGRGSGPGVPWRGVLGYGAALALAAFAMAWVEARHMALLFPTELYIVVIAVGFAGLGIWVGRRMTAPRGTPPDRRAILSAHGITEREALVLDLLAEGQSNKEIARAMGISPNTVKTHVARLYDKLGVHRRTQALARARDLSMIG